MHAIVYADQIPIALALQARGHDVLYVTGQSKIPLLARLGLPATQSGPSPA